ncbi:hypothetical protein GCM10023322_81500 [Rugosimonospora acidiphila]|uniref:Methyltransferase small domain-containing protein n=1 Tax=Rugosimonospora acidiphila TaxID=556531 RepID=A0ABP9SUD4_9ACTN
MVDLRIDGESFALTTAAGVFGAQGVDRGTMTLLRHAPAPRPATGVVDLGAGYGPIAVTLGRRQPAAGVWAVEVNERALGLIRSNASRVPNVVAARPEEVPPALRFDGLYSNPPIKIGKDALHELLLDWLGRLVPGGYGWLVVKQAMGADSLRQWLDETGYPTDRAAAKQGYRLLRVRAGGGGQADAGPAATGQAGTGPGPLAPDDLATIGAGTGGAWTVLGHLHGGGSDPVYLLGRGALRAVLKLKHGAWWADQLSRAATTVEELRAAGYPTPPVLGFGRLDEDRAYLLTGFVRGETLNRLDPATLDAVLGAVALHGEVRPSPVRDWSVMVTSFLNGGIADFTFHPDVLPLARRALDLVSRPVPALPTGGFAHGDFTLRNLLFHEGGLAAVLDLEGFGRGTPVIDLVSLLTATTDPVDGSPDVTRRIVEYAVSLGGTDAFLACLAHRVLATVSWATEHPQLLTDAARRARALLDAVD